MKIAVCGVDPRSNHYRTYVNFLASRGHNVTVITNTNDVDAPVDVVNIARKITGLRFMPPGMGLLIRLSRLFRALRSAPFDVLDVMQVTPDGVYAAWLWRGPLMLDFWGSDILRLETRPWWIRRLMPRVVRKADRIHAVSEHMTRVLVAMGADPSRIETFQYGADLGVEQSVTFLGLVSREEVSARLRRAAVWVSIPPSDGMPLSLLEAMASGALPVVSDLDTMREWLDESRAVFVDSASPEHVAEAILRGLTLAEDGAYAEPNRRAVQQRGDRQANLPRWERMLLAAAGRRDVI